MGSLAFAEIGFVSKEVPNRIFKFTARSPTDVNFPPNWNSKPGTRSRFPWWVCDKFVGDKSLPCRTHFPKLLPATAELGAAQGDDCVGSAQAPAHA